MAKPTKVNKTMFSQKSRPRPNIPNVGRARSLAREEDRIPSCYTLHHVYQKNTANRPKRSKFLGKASLAMTEGIVGTPEVITSLRYNGHGKEHHNYEIK